MLLSSTVCYGELIQGEVDFDVPAARQYVFDDIPQFKLCTDMPYEFKRSNNVQKMIYSYDNFNRIIGITVQYKNEPDKAYIYDKDKITITPYENYESIIFNDNDKLLDDTEGVIIFNSDI